MESRYKAGSDPPPPPPSGINAPERASVRRRDQVLTTAIEILAERGVRGLTHREVDRRLAWPLGSTSNYYRRRNDMLVAVTARIMQTDLADLADLATRTGATSHATPSTHGITADWLASQLSQLLETWMQPPARSRTVARAEILFESMRNADVLQATHEQIGLAEATFSRIFAALGSVDPRASAGFFAILMTGMSAGVCITSRPVQRHDLEVLVRAWITVSIPQGAPAPLPTPERLNAEPV